jgi:pyruvate dehydrogenase E1 component
VTSYKNLHLDAQETERWNMFHPDKEAKLTYVSRITKGESGVFISASDYVQLSSDALAKWLPGPLHSLGTFGFGRSEGRSSLRDFFEVNRRHIAFAALSLLHQDGKMTTATLKQAVKDLQIDPERISPLMNM